MLANYNSARANYGSVYVLQCVLIVVLGLLLWKRGHMGKRGEKGRFRRGAIPVTRVGKTATFLLFFGLPVIMLGAAFPAAEPFATPIGWTLTLAGAVVYWMAGIDYALRTRARGKAPTVGSNSHGSLD